MSSAAAISATARRALSGYRRLFRARAKLFVGDDRAMRESRLAIRAEFDKNRHVPFDSGEQLEGLLGMIDDAEDMLLHGIVRGELNEERNVVEVKIAPEHESRMDPDTITHIEPISAETLNGMEGSGELEVLVTKSSGIDGNDRKTS